MLAAQAHSSHTFMTSKSSEIPVVFSSTTTLLVSTTVNCNISPTSVSSSASNFIYPSVSGRCQFVNDFIIEKASSVLAYSPVSDSLNLYVHYITSVTSFKVRTLTWISSSKIWIFSSNRCYNLRMLDQDGSSALMYAAQAGNLNAVKYLVISGSNTEQQRKVSWSELN